MITQAEYQRDRELRGKFINYWLEGFMLSEELVYLIEDVAHKKIVETATLKPIVILEGFSYS